MSRGDAEAILALSEQKAIRSAELAAKEAKIRRLHAEGMGSRDIAQRLGMSPKGVLCAFGRLGLKPNRRSVWREP